MPEMISMEFHVVEYCSVRTAIVNPPTTRIFGQLWTTAIVCRKPNERRLHIEYPPCSPDACNLWKWQTATSTHLVIVCAKGHIHIRVMMHPACRCVISGFLGSQYFQYHLTRLRTSYARAVSDRSSLCENHEYKMMLVCI